MQLRVTVIIRGGLVAVGATAAVVLGGCAEKHSSSLNAVLSLNTRPNATYSERQMRACLQAQHVVAGTQTLENARAGLAKYGAVPDGLTGQIPVYGDGSAHTPIGTAMNAYTKPPKGLSFGPPINGMTIVFFKNAELARRGEENVVAQYVYKKGVPEKLKSFLFELYGSPPPLDAIPKVVTLAGNTLVIWDYPLTHTVLSNRIVERCLAASRA